MRQACVHTRYCPDGGASSAEVLLAAQAIAAIVDQAERCLAKAELLPVQHAQLPAAILGALAGLARRHPASPHAARGLAIVQQHAAPDMPFLLRNAATLALQDADRAGGSVASALRASADASHPSIRLALLEQCWMQQSRGVTGNAALPEHQALVELHRVFGDGHASPRARHLAFMLLQSLAGRPPSLFKEPVAEQLPTGDCCACTLLTATDGWQLCGEC